MKHSEKFMGRRNSARHLNLDSIYGSSDPEVKSYLMKCFQEELKRPGCNIVQVSDRIAQRMANRFSHLLPPDQRALLKEPQAAAV